MYCTLYFVYVRRAVLLELYKIVHRFESMFNRDVRLKVHLKTTPPFTNPHQFSQKLPWGTPITCWGGKLPPKPTPPTPRQAARRWCKHQCTDPPAPGHEEILNVIIGQVAAAVAALLPQGQNIFLRIVLCSKYNFEQSRLAACSEGLVPLGSD